MNYLKTGGLLFLLGVSIYVSGLIVMEIQEDIKDELGI